MRTYAKIVLAIVTVSLGHAEARTPALEGDSLSLSRIENGSNAEPKFYLWAATGAGPMFVSARSDMGAWFMSLLSFSASTPAGWLMTIRFPELGFPPPVVFPAEDPAQQTDSLLGYSVLAGKRKRWNHAHLSLAAGINHAQGVRIRSHDSCETLFTGCKQTVDGKERFRGFAPILEIEALTGWRWFALGGGISVLGSRHQTWGWHIQFAAGRVF